MTGWVDRAVCVAGLGVSGVAAAEVLVRRGAAVTVVDAADDDARRGRAELLRALGVTVHLGAAEQLPPATDLVVTSPGWRPDQPLLRAAAAAGVPVWGEVELAWRLRGPGAADWLALTGTNGKSTAVRMLAEVLAAAGRRAAAVGNVGAPLVAAVVADPPYELLAVELSSFQLHWSATVRPAAAAVLNIAPDHLDWHGSFDAYAEAKARIWQGPVSIGNADDVEVARRLRSAPGRQVTFTVGPPAAGQLGVTDDGRLVDRAFAEDAPLLRVDELPVTGAHNVANALAAAALARAAGIDAADVGAGLRRFRPDPHRNQVVATVAGVTYVDDSKATNPHAAAASLAAYPSVVWIAGGLDKGLAFDELVRDAAPRLAGVVLLGACRPLLRDALARHAPQVPVREVTATETEAMAEAVSMAADLATPGDTVLLAPAAASMDMFVDYKQRGDVFAAAVRTLPGGPA